MGFPNDIAEQALLDSGRHCCICHKFCSFKIELHHIVPSAEGGEDTYDNCIPLCLDCHAEVKAYDLKHPKGRKYSTSELKGHRDRWYEKVNRSHGTLVNPDYLELDRKLFLEIRRILPSTGSIEFVREQDYGEPFPWKKHDDLRNFRSFTKKPECEFMDTDLEGLRARLAQCIDQFLNLIGQYAFMLDTNVDFSHLERDPYEDPKTITYYRQVAKDKKEFGELMDAQQKRIHQQWRDVNLSADQICKTYDEFVRLGRRKLAV